MADVAQPMGYVDAIEIGDKKLTIQTEYFPRPSPHMETKVYLGGALKKVYSEELRAADSAALQKALSEFHQTKMQEIVEGLKKKLK
jgi:hypothetical protein